MVREAAGAKRRRKRRPGRHAGRARDLVRALRTADASARPDPRRAAGGTYFLNECLILSPADSGTEKGLVTWAAYQGEHPVLSGGQRLTGWTRIKINGRDAWVAKLPGGPTGHQ